MYSRASLRHSLPIINRDPHIKVGLTAITNFIVRSYRFCIIVGIGTLLISREIEVFWIAVVIISGEPCTHFELINSMLVVCLEKLWGSSFSTQMCMALSLWTEWGRWPCPLSLLYRHSNCRSCLVTRSPHLAEALIKVFCRGLILPHKRWLLPRSRSSGCSWPRQLIRLNRLIGWFASVVQ